MKRSEVIKKLSDALNLFQFQYGGETLDEYSLRSISQTIVTLIEVYGMQPPLHEHFENGKYYQACEWEAE